jgi:hypothetical protein
MPDRSGLLDAVFFADGDAGGGGEMKEEAIEDVPGVVASGVAAELSAVALERDSPI